MVYPTAPLRRMTSTLGGMRRLLKYKGSVPNYIRQAVETGIYRSNEELATVWKERRESADDLATIMRRFRQDIVRGSHVQDYPVEYLILRQHPPIPDPPRVPKRIAKKMREAPNPTEQLVEKYLSRQERRRRQQQSAAGAPQSTEEYYRRLLGVSAPPPTSSMGQKPAAVQKAYAAAVKQYQLQRTEGISEDDALAQVEELLAQQDVEERMVSRDRAQRAQELRRNHPNASIAKISSKRTTVVGPKESSETGSSGESLEQTLKSIFASDRTVEGMMRWSERLQAVPYVEWTIGASTALDHWIACRLLGLSEETWESLLEGDDPSLLSRGRDIVAVREALFPETVLDLESIDQIEILDDDDSLSGEPKSVSDKSIEELLASLGGSSDSAAHKASEKIDSSWLSASDGVADLDAKVDTLVLQLQDWRRMNAQTPYNQWADAEKEKFTAWMKDYIATVSSDAEMGRVDYNSTREALLSQPPVSLEDSQAFWDELNDEDRAAGLLAAMLRDGPPAGASVLHSAFWELSYEDQLDKLLNLGAIRPLLDEYTRESDRQKFLQRYGDTLLGGVVMEHLVPDPDGPVQASDLAEDFGFSKDTRFRLEMKAYQSTENLSVDERTRAMFVAWNSYKSGRARYEEKLFRTGRLGLRYSDRVPKDNELNTGKDTEDE